MCTSIWELLEISLWIFIKLIMDRKRALNEDEGRAAKRRKEGNQSDTSEEVQAKKLFSGYQIFVLSAGLGKARTDIFKKQLSKYGADVCEKFSSKVSYIIVDEAMTSERFLKITKLSADEFASAHPVVVKANWLSTCLSEERLVNTSEFELFIDFSSKSDKKASERTSKHIDMKTLQTSDTVDDSRGMQKADMVGHAKPEGRTAQKEANYESDDSNYVPSDEDDRNDEEADETSTSNQSTPTTSPSKLPVSIFLC